MHKLYQIIRKQVINIKEEFKTFVRKKPELIKYVNSGNTSWQQLYETWNLYGEKNEIWNNYDNTINEEQTSKKEEFNMSNIADIIKKIDMNQVQKGVTGLQKIIELIQGFSAKEEVSTNNYEPRQLFKKFED